MHLPIHLIPIHSIIHQILLLLSLGLFTQVITTTHKAVSSPSDVAFHHSMDHGFAQDLDALSERVLLVANKLLNLVATVDQSQGIRGKGKGKLASQDDVVDNFHALVVDSMDQLLEKMVSYKQRLFSRPSILIYETYRIYVSTTF